MQFLLQNIRKYIIPVIYALSISWATMGFAPSPVIAIQASALVLCILCIIKRGTNINMLSLFFIGYIPISILAANPDPLFKSWYRFCFFTLLFLVASPLLQNDITKQFRKSLLYCLITICSLLSFASFFCYYLGINYMVFYVSDSMEYYGSAGYFSGLMRDSMMLGPLSGVSAIFLYHISRQRGKIFLIMSICCALSCVFSASRAAIFPLFIAFGTYLYHTKENKKKFFKQLAIISCCLIISFPLWHNAFNGVILKQKHRNEMSGNFDSRSEKFSYRLDEFYSSPVWGIGFASIDPKGQDVYIPETGIIEPGSSWLAVLSMCGSIGFILFCMIILKAFFATKFIVDDYSILLHTLILYLMFHMIAEGYIFSAGNALCHMIWLLIGCSYDIKREYEKNNLNITNTI